MTAPAVMQQGESLLEYVQRLTDAAAQIPDLEEELQEVKARLAFAQDCKGKIATLTKFTGYFDKQKKVAGAPVRQVVLEHLAAHGPCTPRQIRQANGLDHNSVSPALIKLVREGKVARQADGTYAYLMPGAPTPAQTPPAAPPVPEPAPVAPDPELRARVLGILVRPGRVRTEAQLSAQLGVGVVVVRDALRALQSEGVVRMPHPGGDAWERAA